MNDGMRFLILNTDYADFIRWLYTQHPRLEQKPYEEQMRVRAESLFGVADFYSGNLRKLGHEAWDIYANNEFMQKAWAKEHGIRVEEAPLSSQAWENVLALAKRLTVLPLRYTRRVLCPLMSLLNGRPHWFHDILTAQIKYYKPDVLLNQDMGISSRFLKEMKPYVRLLVGQHAANRLPESEDWNCYDLVISSFPPTVEYFREKGIGAKLHRLAFEPKVLPYLETKETKYDVTFVGSFHSIHSSRVVLLEALCSQFPGIRIWGPGIERVSHGSPIQACYRGQGWGRDMYQILSDSKITLNHHGDIPPYANNCRLYEATGVGTMLITDWKANLHEMFEPGKEVVGYRSQEECAELIQYYLTHDAERAAVTRAGQKRTLRDHTYEKRMGELVDIVRGYL